jgi:hypothetical protein
MPSRSFEITEQENLMLCCSMTDVCTFSDVYTIQMHRCLNGVVTIVFVFIGRFDFHVELTAPAANERAAILSQIVTTRGLKCPDDVATGAAAKCDGADASDMVKFLV